MDREELERRYIRKPKEEQKIEAIDSYFYAYKDGVFVEEVKLTAQTRLRYEAMGYTFKRRRT